MLMNELMEEDRLRVSTQVLQELFVTLTRKAARPYLMEEALAVLEDLAAWPLMVVDSNGRNRDIGGGQADALARVVAFKQAGQAGDRPGDGIELQALEKIERSDLFRCPHAGVNFRDVNAAACQKMALLREVSQKSAAVALAIEDIDDNAGIEQECRHVSGRLLLESASHPAGAACPPIWRLPVSARDGPCPSRSRQRLPGL